MFSAQGCGRNVSKRDFAPLLKHRARTHAHNANRSHQHTRTHHETARERATAQTSVKNFRLLPRCVCASVRQCLERVSTAFNRTCFAVRCPGQHIVHFSCALQTYSTIQGSSATSTDALLLRNKNNNVQSSGWCLLLFSSTFQKQAQCGEGNPCISMHGSQNSSRLHICV